MSGENYRYNPNEEEDSAVVGGKKTKKQEHARKVPDQPEKMPGARTIGWI